MNTITLSAGNVSLTAALNDSPIARQIWQALPVEGKANRWGDGIYFKLISALTSPNLRMSGPGLGAVLLFVVS